MRLVAASVLVMSVWVSAVAPAFGQTPLDDTVNSATAVLREIMAIPSKCIPESLLREAQGVAVVPGLVKGGFIIGVEHGKGVLTTRDDAGLWRAPVFITITGGGIGAQAGVQAIDLVLVFKTRRSVQGILKGKVTIGADLSVAAGPVGRQALAATDAQLKAEILSYSRSRGLFAGVAIDGASMRIDHGANAEYYALRPGAPPGSIPASGIAFAQLVSTYAPPPRPAVALLPVREVQPPPAYTAPDERETVQGQLLASGQRLQSSLDPSWQQYLALPGEVVMVQPVPAGSSIEPVLQRYQTIANDPRYRALNERQDFQETYALLRRYAAFAQPRPGGALVLPAPPDH